MAGCDAMRHVLVGGEALPPALAARFQERCRHAHLHNAYGPTETTVDATGSCCLICMLSVATGAHAWRCCCSLSVSCTAHVPALQGTT